MASVFGQPDPQTSFLRELVLNTNWSDCVKNCFNDIECYLAYGNSSLIFAMYGINDFLKIRNYGAKGTPEEDRTAIKMDFLNGECGNSLDDFIELASGVIFVSPQTIEKSVTNFSVAEVDNYYEITYSYKADRVCEGKYEPSVACEKCTSTVVRFYGFPYGTPSNTYNNFDFDVCVRVCINTANCFLAYMDKIRKCNLYNFGTVNSLSITTDAGIYPATTNYLAMKHIHPSSTSCVASYSSIFDRIVNLLPFGTNYESLRITTSMDNVVFNWVTI